jgi:hypothetical protein
MLERHDLLVRPWTAAKQGQFMKQMQAGAWVRAIVDPEIDRLHGFALLHPTLQFLSWLGGQRIEIHESEDASLLATVVRPIGVWRRWRVRDAEDHQVGSFYGTIMFNQFGDRMAELEDHLDGGVLLGESGVELGWVTPRKDGSSLVRFNKYAAEKNPFVRMVLLGCVIGQAGLPA